MKSKINVRKTDCAELELVIENKLIVGNAVISKGTKTAAYPAIDQDVKRLEAWLKEAGSEAKLPSEPVSAYRRVENMMQLGDLLGLGRVD